MKKNSLVIISALMLGSTMASADEATPEFELTGFLKGTNNFMYRGLSLSDNSAAIQGQVTVQHKDGIYATLWGSNTKLQANDGSGSGLEGNFLFGYTNNITEDLSFDIGFLRTFYPGMNRGSRGGPRRDFNDFYGTLMYNGFRAGLSYSDDFFAETGRALYTFVSFDGEIYNKLSLHALIGNTKNSSKGFTRGIFGIDRDNWTHFELGLFHPLPYNFEVSGVYHGVTSNEVKDGFDISGFGTNRFVVSLTKNF